jgi:hypothetical protein
MTPGQTACQFNIQPPRNTHFLNPYTTKWGRGVFTYGKFLCYFGETSK